MKDYKKQQQEKHIIDMMKSDEELGIYNHYNSKERKISETESSIIVFILLVMVLLTFVGLFINELIGWS